VLESTRSTACIPQSRGWIFTNAIVSGYFNETETGTVAWDGKSYSGTNDTKIYDLSGNLQIQIPGTATATRIAP
jgi:hypothetical protein